MKKRLVLFIAVVISAMAVNAWATTTTYEEIYSPNTWVYEGDYWSHAFDFSGIIAPGETWSSAVLGITFSSLCGRDYASIGISHKGNWQTLSSDNTSKNYSYTFSSSWLTEFQSSPQFSIVIWSQNEWDWNMNGFIVNSVSFAIETLTTPENPGPGSDPVPEPATLLLLGAGLAGVAGLKRRRQKVNG